MHSRHKKTPRQQTATATQRLGTHGWFIGVARAGRAAKAGSRRVCSAETAAVEAAAAAAATGTATATAKTTRHHTLCTADAPARRPTQKTDAKSQQAKAPENSTRQARHTHARTHAPVHLRGSGDHVLDIVSVAGAVHVGVVPARCLVLHVSGVDCDLACPGRRGGGREDMEGQRKRKARDRLRERESCRTVRKAWVGRVSRLGCHTPASLPAL